LAGPYPDSLGQADAIVDHLYFRPFLTIFRSILNVCHRADV
jgi:hypothetical protein